MTGSTPFERYWSESFDRLDEVLEEMKKGEIKCHPKNKTIITAKPGKQELFITREFDAPRELVFKAHTDPNFMLNGLVHVATK